MTNFKLLKKNDVTLPYKYDNFTRSEFPCTECHPNLLIFIKLK